MTEGQVYRCQNPDCRREIRVNRASVEPDLNPRCSCGAEMKKPYDKPVLRTLNSKIETLTGSKTNRE